MTTYKIDKRFHTTVERTDRVLEIAEAFGLGLDDKEFVVFDNQPIDIEQGDIVYVTGQSGAGKSTVLRELAERMVEGGLNVVTIDEVPLLDCPLIDQIGKNTTEALNFLSIAGLNDAYLFIRKPAELSDGQRYRFRLAKIIESGAQVWVADEFLAVLDRVTAKVLAFNLQKIARKVGATVIVATTHGDMVDDLAPSLYIEKRYREKVRILRPGASADGFREPPHPTDPIKD
jgi:ABC-type ATPase with predicted acetyltransferase domain